MSQKTVEGLLFKMKQMFDDGLTKIEQKIESSFSNLMCEIATIREDVQQLKTKCVSDINRLTQSLSKLDSEVKSHQNAVDQMGKANDLILTGVPYIRTENTDDIFRKVASSLGYGGTDVPTVFTKRLARVPPESLDYGGTDVPHVFTKRMARVPLATSSSPPILLQFAFKAARDEFFRRYLSTRNIGLLQIGFNINRRVYLNENLTESARKIKGCAVKLKKDGLLHDVFSKDGTVYIRLAVDTPAKAIFDLDQLRSLENNGSYLSL